jgi:hypothetical protein
MSYENISINITAVEESLSKLRNARLGVQTEIDRLEKHMGNILGEGLTAEEHKESNRHYTIAIYEAVAMDAMITLIGNTLTNYAGTDELLAKRISKALYGR